MPSNNRKREIRALMAETGLNYMKAMRIVDERRAKARAEAKAVEAGDEEQA
jgi:hypothetical protein